MRLLQNVWIFASRARRYRPPVVGRASSMLAGLAAIALVASQPALCEGRFEIVNFQSLTFPGALFVSPFMAAPEQGAPANIFGILRLPETPG